MTNDEKWQFTDEQVLTKLTWLLGLIDELTERYEKRPLPTFGRTGSQIAADDAALGPLAASYRIGNCLMIALDQLHTVRVILQPDPKQPVISPFIGPYPNIRAALEAAALAVYLLDPDDPGERRARVLNAAWDGVLRAEDTLKAECAPDDGDDAKTRSKKARDLAKALTETKAKKVLIREYGGALSIEDRDYANVLPGYRAIVLGASQGLEHPASYVRFAWEQISGMSHPSFERNSNLAPQAVSTRTDGSEHLDAPRANLGFLYATIHMATTTLDRALSLASARGNDLTLRFVRRADAPDPPAV